MKTKKFKSILVSAVGILYALVGLLTGGIFFASSSAATTNVLDAAIKGYDSATNKYSYIYLGEYPQSRVLQIRNGAEYADEATGYDGWSDFPNYTDGSVDAEATIKGYIEEMCEQYYNTYIPSNTSNAYFNKINDHFEEVGIEFDDYDWQSATILTFYPQENYETEHLYFDAKAGYYTLKTNVVYSAGVTSNIPGTVAYPAGTKFHTYNHAVYTYDNQPDIINADGEILTNNPKNVYETTSITSTSSLFSKPNVETTGWFNDYDGDGTAESPNTIVSGAEIAGQTYYTYLYVVEPIKWRVLSRDGNQVLLRSESNLATLALNVGVGGNEWVYSTKRGWLNGESNTVYKDGAECSVSYSGKTFFDVAFDSAEKNAIVPTEIAQDADKSYWNGAWHSYTGTGAESRPTATVKVFELSLTDHKNTSYGLDTADETLKSNITVSNTEYSFNTGCYDTNMYLLPSGGTMSYQVANSYIPTRTASATNEGVVITGTGGVLSIYTIRTVCPAMYVDLSKLDVASIAAVSEKGWLSTNGVLPNDNTDDATLGTAQNPISLDYSTQMLLNGDVNTSVAYSYADSNISFASLDGEVPAGTDIQSIASKMGGSFSVDSITSTGDGTYSHIVKVNYSNQPAGSYLVAKVVDPQTGSTIAMAPITNLLTNTANDTSTSAYFVSGTTHFELTRTSKNADYKVVIYACSGGVLAPANIYMHIDGNTNGGDVSSLISGWNSSANLYDYVYLGEYPQNSVHKKITSSSATDGYNGGTAYGTFTTDSVNVSNQILKLIDELVDTFYNGSPLDDSTFFTSWLSSSISTQGLYINGSGVTVNTFYPTEDFETNSLYFDASTGYYTLKVPVSSGEISYEVGTKFHTYNNAVDVLQKYGYYRNVNDGVLSSTGYSASGATKSTLISSSTVSKDKQAYTVENATSTYLFEVKPIKWRVVEAEGNHLTLLADDILDSIKFNYNTQYGNEWAYSMVRAWLNGLDENPLYYGTNQRVQYSVGRSFLDLAFSSNIQKAIVPHTKVQDTYNVKPSGFTNSFDFSGSYYNGKWHYYNLATAQAYEKTSSDVELSPQTYDKVWLPANSSLTDGSWILKASLASRIMYNSDYSIATGNKDYSLSVGNSLSEPNENGAWIHNTRENKIAYISSDLSNNGAYAGGEFTTSSAYVDSQSNTRGFQWDANLKAMTLTEARGVTPCITIDLTALDMSSVTIDSYTGSSDSSVGQGASGNPIDAMTSGQLAFGASFGTSEDFVAYSVSPNSMGKVQTSGSWSVLAKTAVDDNYKYTIAVDYSGLYAQGFLTVKVTDVYGSNIAFATIANGEVSSKGTTYFTFEGKYDNIDEYIVEIYVGLNSNLVSAGIYQNSSAGNGKVTGTIWFDPLNGHDNNTGLREEHPIKSIQKLKQIAGPNATVVVLNTINIAADTTFDLSNLDVTLKVGFDGVLFNAEGTQEQSVKFVLSGFTIDGLQLDKTTTRYYLQSSSSAPSIVNATNADLIISNCNFKNLDSQFAGNYITATNSNLHIEDCTFEGNNFTGNAAAVYFNGGKLTMLNCAFLNNYSQGNFGCVVISNASDVVVENCQFTNNSTKGAGAAVRVAEGTQTVLFENCIFDSNESELSGGAILNLSSKLTLRGCTFMGNVCGYQLGSTTAVDCTISYNGQSAVGGSAVATFGNIVVDDCNFNGNIVGGSGARGGAIYIVRSITSATISNSNFVGNTAYQGGALVIYLPANSNVLTIDSCYFEANKATNYGGAIFLGGDEYYSVAWQIDACTFISNQSGSHGGAISTFLSNGLASNCYFAKNSAANSGGGIYFFFVAGLENCTFEYNLARYGAAFGATSQLHITNGINASNNVNATTDSMGAVALSYPGDHHFNVNNGEWYIHNNYKNLYDKEGNLVTTIEQLESLLDSDGNIIPSAEAVQSNLYLTAGKIAILNSSHSNGYKRLTGNIGLTIKTTMFEDGEIALLQNNNGANYWLTQDVLDVFEYQPQSGEKVKMYVSGGYVYLKLQTSNELFYTASDCVATYDGTEHTILVSVHESVAHTITYSLEETGDYTEDAPTFTDAGTYTVYYKIVADGYADIAGSSKVTILQAQATVFKANAKLTTIIGKTFNKGDDISSLISGFEVVDMHGNAVAGRFIYNSSTATTITSATSTLDAIKFLPYNSNYVCKEPFAIPVVIEYTELYYGAATGKFSATSSGEYAFSATLAEVVGYLTDGATLYFASAYIFAADESVAIDAKRNITFAESGTGGILNISENANVNIDVVSGSLLTIAINASSTTTSINVAGNLSMVGNIKVVGRTSSSPVVAISSVGTAYFENVLFDGDGIQTEGCSAISNRNKATFKNCTITNYFNSGRPAYTLFSAGETTLHNTLVIKNYATQTTANTDEDVSSAGAGIVLVDGAKLYAYNSTISYNQIISSDNSFTDGNFAGNLYVGSDSYAYLENCEVSYGSAYAGAGIVLAGGDEVGGTLKAVNTKIDNNFVLTQTQDGKTYSYGYGAGVFVGHNAVAQIIGGSVSGNIAQNTENYHLGTNTEGYGGGIYVDGGSLTLDGGVVIQNNVAACGGAIYANGGSQITIGDCIIQNNSVYYDSTDDEKDIAGSGGAIYITGSVTLNLNDGCQILGNTATYGSAIYANGDITLNIRGAKISNNTIYNSREGIGIIEFRGSSNASTLNFYYGEVSGNKASGTGTKSAFRIFKATFNMYGGKITGNDLYGVYANAEADANSVVAKVNLYGGEICYNKNGVVTQGYTDLLVDGVNIYSNDGRQISCLDYVNTTLTILSGKVLMPVVTDANYGIVAGSNVTVNLLGGEIDCIMSDPSLNLGGNPKVNKGIYTTGPISVTSPLTGDASVIFTQNNSHLASLISDNAGKFIAVPSAFSEEQIKDLFNYISLQNSNYVFDQQNFVSDGTNYYISVVEGTSTQTAIYFNPASGNDESDGTTQSSAVKTWEKVLDIVSADPTIATVYVVGTWTISQDFEFSNAQNLTLVLLSQEASISVESGATVKFSNCSFESKSNTYAPYFVNAGNLILDNCYFAGAYNVLYTSGSTTYGDGYGGAIQSTGGSLVVTNSTFENNKAAYGGAIAVTSGTLTVNNCLFKDNFAYVNSEYTGSKDSYGGAIYIYSNAVDITATILNSTFVCNQVGTSDEAQGGAIYAASSKLNGNSCYINLDVQNCRFDGNYATTTSTETKAIGGAIYATRVDVLVENCLFNANYATSDGGALYLTNNKATLNKLTATGNYVISTAGTSAAFLHLDTYNETLDVVYTNCNISNNAANRIDMFVLSSSATIQNISYIGNEASLILQLYTYKRASNKVVVDNVVFKHNTCNVCLYDQHWAEVEMSNITIENNTCVEAGIGVHELNDSSLSIEDYGNTTLRNINISNNLGGFSAIHYRASEISITANRQVNISNSNIQSNGYAIRLSYCNPTNITFNLSNITISNSRGGIYGECLTTDVPSYVINTALNISDCNISGAGKESGYGIYASNVQNVSINKTYVSNFATSSNGAGIYINKVREFSLTNSYVYNNTAGLSGGGVYVIMYSGSSAVFEVENCHIHGNTATRSRGGGLYVDVGNINATASVKNCHIHGNTAELSGGGVFAARKLKMYNCLVENNRVNITSSTDDGIWEDGVFKTYGGGGVNIYYAYIYNTTIKNNYSGYKAGGLSTYLTYEIKDVVIENNTAAVSTGGYYTWAQADLLENVTIKGNVAPSIAGANIRSDKNSKIVNLQVIGNVITNSSTVLNLDIIADIYNLYVADNYLDGTSSGGSDVVSITTGRQVNMYGARFANNRNFDLIIEYTYNSARPAPEPISLYNVEFTGNQCANLINTNSFDKQLSFIDCTFAGNLFAGTGGLVAKHKSVYFKGCQIYGNTNTGGGFNEAQIIKVFAGARYTLVNTKIYDNLLNNPNLAKYAVVYNQGELIMDGCVVANNTYADYSSSKIYQGGILTTSGAYLMARNTTFEGRTSAGRDVKEGVGILYFEQNSLESNLENVTISGFSFGAGSAIVNHGNINLRDVKTQNNAGTSGLLLQNYATAKIMGDSTMICGNTATGNGGVVFNNTGANLVVLSGVLKGNKAANGGAIYNNVGANLSVISGELTANYATTDASTYNGFGGAIYNLGNLTINGGEITNNIADSGAGVYNLGTMTVNDGEFSGNKIVTAGGAIYNGQDTIGGTTYTGNLVINYAEFNGNSNHYNSSTDTQVSYGLAIANYSAVLTIHNATFANNDNFLTTSNDAINANINVYGGAIYVEGQNSVTNIYGGEWTLNKASIPYGLGLCAKDTTVNIENINVRLETDIDQSAFCLVGSATLNFENCSFVLKAEKGGIGNTALITGHAGQGSKNNLFVNLTNCHFKSLEEDLNYSTGYYNFLVYSVFSCQIENCLFEGAFSNVLFYAIDNLDILNSKFTNIIKNYDTPIIQTEGGQTIIDGCEFSNITKPSYIVTSSYNAYLTVSNTKFTNNTINGNGAMIGITASMPVQISNVTIKDNVINGTGGGIYVADLRSYIGETSVTLFGNNTIQNNKFVAGGGIYFNEQLAGTSLLANDRLIIGNGGKLIVDNNYLINTSGNILTNPDGSYKESNISITSKVEYGGVTHKIYLAGGLASGSKIGLNMYQTENFAVTSKSIAIYGDSANPITSKDLSMFTYDNGDYELRLIGGNIVLYSPSVLGQGVVVSDKVVFADGNYHGFETSDFRVVGTSGQIENFKVLFAATQDGEYSEQSPTYAHLGEHTIWYKIVDQSGNAITNASGEALTGSVTLNIVNKVLTLVEAPTALMNNGAQLSTARFVGGLVVSDGYEVAGTWAFNDSATIPSANGESFLATFTAASQGVYANTITANIKVKFAFDWVEYKDVNGTVGFYSLANGAYTNTGFSLLSEIVPYIADNGKLIMHQTYTFQTSESVEATGRVNVLFASAGFNTTAFKVDGTSSISVAFSGAITFDGQNVMTNKVDNLFLFEVAKNSSLTLGTGVSVVRITKSGQKGFIANYGTLVLSGANFKDNKTMSITCDVYGGVVYNEGTLNIMSGNFVNNRACASMTNTSDSTINNSAFGGFVYNVKTADNTGSVVILGGTFNNNSVGGYFKHPGHSQEHNCTGLALGGVVYSNGGSVDVLGGYFARNNAQSSGGVVANAGGTIMLNGGQMAFNTAGISGGAVYNDDSISGGTIIYNGTVISLNSLASDVTVGSAALANSNSVWFVVAGTLSLAVALVAAYALMHAKRKGKKYNKR